MEIVTDRTEYEILCVLDRKNRAVTSVEIEKELKKIGIEISRRRINQYLELLDEKELSENLGRSGRRITNFGREEVVKAFGAGKVLIYDQARFMITEAQFNLDKKSGEVIVNLSFIKADKEKAVVDAIRDICTNSNLIPPFIKIVYEGEEVYNQEVRKGEIGLVTFSSITLDYLLMKNGIYTDPQYVALLELRDYKPLRCIGIYSYAGSSSDYYELFIRGKVASVYTAIKSGAGILFVDHRHIPYLARERAVRLMKKAVEVFGGVVIIGGRNHDLGVRPREGYLSIFATGGELIPGVLSELNIPITNLTGNALINFKELNPVCEVIGEVIEL